MKSCCFIVVIWVGAIAGLAAPVSAAEYETSFRFAISVPDDWFVLTREEVAANADAFIGEDASSELAFIPLSMRRMIYDRVMAGELDVFYRRGIGPGSFVDNVNILVQKAELPNSPDQLERICALLPAEFSRVFGRPIAMDVCAMRERAGRRALYLQFDGALEGTTTLQYQFQRTQHETLILTATAPNENLPRLLGEFEAMIASIRLH